VVDVDGSLAAVGDDSRGIPASRYWRRFHHRPGAWILVPDRLREQVGTAVPVHVERC